MNGFYEDCYLSGKKVGYKLFKVKKSAPGKIFPLYVFANEATPIGEWIPAKKGEQNENGKVKSKLGPLCYRPGWHLSDIPLATHIGVKDANGNIVAMHPDEVWCEVEYSDNVDYQPLANENGWDWKKKRVVPSRAMLKEIPVDGYYRYKTNPNMFGDWIIAGSIKVNRVLSDEEANAIVRANGYEPLPREAAFNMEDYGFAV